MKLEDAFFADPDAVNTRYVLPVRITSASDSILEGTPKEAGAMPSVVDKDAWSVAPKNYTIYAIQYINKWAGVWLSKSKTSGVNNGKPFSAESNAPNWEKADLKYLTSKSLTESRYSFTHPTVMSPTPLTPPDVQLPVAVSIPIMALSRRGVTLTVI